MVAARRFNAATFHLKDTFRPQSEILEIEKKTELTVSFQRKQRKKEKKLSCFFFFWGGGAIEVQCSAGVKVQLERLSPPTRVINVASPQGSSWAECVCMNECVYVPACLCVFNNQPSWRQWVVQS